MEKTGHYLFWNKWYQRGKQKLTERELKKFGTEFRHYWFQISFFKFFLEAILLEIKERKREKDNLSKEIEREHEQGCSLFLVGAEKPTPRARVFSDF